MDPVLTGVLQWLTGCGVGLVSVPCNVCTFGLWGCTVQPALVGYTETWVGDALGQQRAAAVWPLVAAYASGIIGAGVGLALSIAYSVSVAARGGSVSNPYVDPLYWGVQGASAGIAVLLSFAVPVTYALVSESKRPGDTGEGFPDSSSRTTRVARRPRERSA